MESGGRTEKWWTSSPFTPGTQHSANCLRIPAQVQNCDDNRHCWLNRIKNTEICSANDGSPEVLVDTRKQIRVPFDPRDGFQELCLKLLRTLKLPGFVKGASLANIDLNPFQELNRLRPHFRRSRRSSWSNDKGLMRPCLYASHRSSSTVLCSAVTCRLSSTPENHSSSASFSRWRFGSLANAGKSASFIRAIYQHRRSRQAFF